MIDFGRHFSANSLAPSRRLISTSGAVPANFSQQTYTFGFKYLVLDEADFPCRDAAHHVNGEKLVNVFDLLCLLSKDNGGSITDDKHSHPVQVSYMKGHALQFIKQLGIFFDNKGLGNKSPLSFGKNHFEERLFGFIEDERPTVFEVLLLDLDHKVYPMKPTSQVVKI